MNKCPIYSSKYPTNIWSCLLAIWIDKPKYFILLVGLKNKSYVQYWGQQGITLEFLSKFWGKLYEKKQSRKYFTCSGYLCVEPCLSIHGCTNFVYPLVVVVVVCKKNHINIVYGTTLSQNWYINICLEYLPVTSPLHIHTWHGGLDITCPLCVSLLCWVFEPCS